jgi:hypothetical protein
MTRWVRPGALLMLHVGLVLPLLAGCGGLHLYNAGRHKTAEEAKTTYDSVKLLEVITVERANLASILNAELEVASRHNQVALQAEWFRLVDSSLPLTEAFEQKAIGKRLVQLGVTANQTVAKHEEALIVDLATLDMEAARREAKARDVASAIRAMFGVEVPRCEREAPALPGEAPKNVKDAAAGQVDTLATLYGRYVKTCNALLEFWKSFETQKGLSAADEGALPAAYQEWRQDERRLRTAQDAAAAAQDKYKQALTQHGQASASRDLKSLQDQAKALRAALDTLRQAGGTVGREKAAEERIAQLDRLLEAAATGKVDAKSLEDPELRKAVAVVAGLPSIGDDALRVQANRRKPAVAPLLIEKQRQEIQRDAAARAVERARRRVELRREKVDALVLELRLLQRARIAVDLARKAAVSGSDPFGLTFREALGTGTSGATKRHLYESIMFYVDSIATARLRQEQLELQLVAVDHEEAVDSAQTAIGLWNALIATPINELVAYHASGIKPEEIAALVIQLVTLGGIATGVNR